MGSINYISSLLLFSVQKKTVIQKEYVYDTHRSIGQRKVAPKCKKIGDKYGVSKMTVKALKQELSARQLSIVGLKVVLVLRLVVLLENEDREISNNDGDNDDDSQ